MNGRLKRFQVDSQNLIGLFNLNTRCDQICVPIIESMPVDGVVVQVLYNWSCQAVEFIVSHPSFDYVEEFADIPRHETKLLGTVMLRKDKDVWMELNR